MRFQWIICILTTLVSMAVLMIIIGQRHVLVMLNNGIERQQMEFERLYNEQRNKEFFKVTLEKLVAQATKVVEELEATVTKLSPEVDKKKSENDGCQGEKKKNDEGLFWVEKENSHSQATFKAETDAWNDEIRRLKEDLTGHRPICDFVKKDPLALKLCDHKSR